MSRVDHDYHPSDHAFPLEYDGLMRNFIPPVNPNDQVFQPDYYLNKQVILATRPYEWEDYVRAQCRNIQGAVLTHFGLSDSMSREYASLLLEFLGDLIPNAMDAIRDVQRTPMAQQTEPNVGITAILTEERRLRIAVSDTGAGINPATETRLFRDPGTNKQVYDSFGGHGKGLHMLAGLAMHTQGTLFGYVHKPGQGAIFWVEVPTRSTASQRIGIRR